MVHQPPQEEPLPIDILVLRAGTQVPLVAGLHIADTMTLVDVGKGDPGDGHIELLIDLPASLLKSEVPPLPEALVCCDLLLLLLGELEVLTVPITRGCCILDDSSTLPVVRNDSDNG